MSKRSELLERQQKSLAEVISLLQRFIVAPVEEMNMEYAGALSALVTSSAERIEELRLTGQHIMDENNLMKTVEENELLVELYKKILMVEDENGQ